MEIPDSEAAVAEAFGSLQAMRSSPARCSLKTVSDSIGVGFHHAFHASMAKVFCMIPRFRHAPADCNSMALSEGS